MSVETAVAPVAITSCPGAVWPEEQGVFTPAAFKRDAGAALELSLRLRVLTGSAEWFYDQVSLGAEPAQCRSVRGLVSHGRGDTTELEDVVAVVARRYPRWSLPGDASTPLVDRLDAYLERGRQ